MKKRMLTASKLCGTVLSIILAFAPVVARSQTPDIAVSIFRDLVRFTASSEIQEVRVQVFSSTGEQVFDSNLVTGQPWDWLLQDLKGQPVGSGLYSYTVTIRDQVGALKEMQHGNLIVDRGREGLDPAPLIASSDAHSSQGIKPKPAESWDVNHGRSPYIINTPAMGIGSKDPLGRLHIGAGTIEPLTKGSTLLLEEAEATGMVLKSTTGGEMFFSQDKKFGLFGTASNHPLGIRTNNLNRFWITGEGNVGIGTINPGSPLTVAGMIETTAGGIKFPDGTIQTTALSVGSDAISRATAATDHNNNSRLGGKKDVEPAGADASWSLTGNVGTDSSNFLGTRDKRPIIFKVNSSASMAEAMRIDPAGNVGIGTLAPLARLHSVISPGDPALSPDIKTAIKGVANVEFGVGVHGITNVEKGAGVLGEGAGENSAGVRGENHGGHGVVGVATGKGSAGVFGVGDSIGIFAKSLDPNGIGVIGTNFANGVGLYGQSSGGEAGHFEGKVIIIGDFGYPPSKLAIGSAAGESLGFGTSYVGFNASRKEKIWTFNGDFANNGGGIIYATVEGKIRLIPKLSSGGSPETLSDDDIASKTRMTVSDDGIEVAGKTITQVLQINGGADLSEKFEVKSLPIPNSRASAPEVQPGLIVSIDPSSPGKLAISSKAYDRKVAGIISGAGGIKSGMLMSQSSSVADGSHPIALTGRVYCWADASNGPINPGDLLTTSKNPGHAMKVTNYARAQGAIIGKAMSRLAKGSVGLVLILVNLQ